MAFYYVTATGTLTSGDNFPHAERDDGTWTTDALCYNSVSDAMVNAGLFPGNSVLTDDGTFLEVTIGGINTAHWANDVILDSRNEDPSLSTISLTSLTSNGLYIQPNTVSSPVITNLTLTFSGTYTSDASAAASMFYAIGTNAGDVTFNNCVIGNFDIDMQDNATLGQGILVGNGSIPSSSANIGLGRWWRFIDCEFTQINELTASNTAMMFGAGSARFSFEVGPLGKGSWKDCTKRTINDAPSFIVPQRAASGAPFVEMVGTASQSYEVWDIDIIMEPGDTLVEPFITETGGQTGHNTRISYTDIRRVVMSGSASANGVRGIFAFMRGNYQVDNIYTEDCSRVAGASGDGGMFYSSDVPVDIGLGLNPFSLTGEMTDMEAYRISTRSGAAVFASNGSVGIFRRIKAYDCVNNVGVIYSGGYGDCIVESCEVIGATAATAGSGVDGVGMLVRFNDPTDAAVQNKTSVIRNVTIADCVKGDNADTGGLHVSSENVDLIPGYEHDVELINVVSQNGVSGAPEYDINVSYLGGVAQTINCTTYSCNALNGIYSDVGQPTVTVTEDNTTTDRPTFVDSANDDYRISEPSGTGDNRDLPYTDANGVLFNDPPNFGAYSLFGGDGASRNMKNFRQQLQNERALNDSPNYKTKGEGMGGGRNAKGPLKGIY